MQSTASVKHQLMTNFVSACITLCGTEQVTHIKADHLRDPGYM